MYIFKSQRETGLINSSSTRNELAISGKHLNCDLCCQTGELGVFFLILFYFNAGVCLTNPEKHVWQKPGKYDLAREKDKLRAIPVCCSASYAQPIRRKEKTGLWFWSLVSC